MYDTNCIPIYTGTIGVTASGAPCQSWDSNTPHTVEHFPVGDGNKNYCIQVDNGKSYGATRRTQIKNWKNVIFPDAVCLVVFQEK